MSGKTTGALPYSTQSFMLVGFFFGSSSIRESLNWQNKES